MSVFGLVLLGFVGITIAVTGIPAFIVLIAGAMVEVCNALAAKIDRPIASRAAAASFLVRVSIRARTMASAVIILAPIL